MKKRIAILLSGRGTNFEAIARNIKYGLIDAEISVVVSNRAGAPGIELAEQLGLPALVIPSQGRERAEYDALLIDALRSHQTDLVCLAGFMRLLSPSFVDAYRGRILNIHPSLLPAFPGLEAQRQALEYGVKIAGCTVHYVDESLDGGKILLQASVRVLEDDTVDSLSARILVEEHRLYTEAINLVLRG